MIPDKVVIRSSISNTPLSPNKLPVMIRSPSDRQKNTRIHSEPLRYVYLGVIILWIILGMAYIFRVIELISTFLKAGGSVLLHSYCECYLLVTHQRLC